LRLFNVVDDFNKYGIEAVNGIRDKILFY
jgi:hypothetical protein